MTDTEIRKIAKKVAEILQKEYLIPNTNDFCGIGEAAKILGVSISTVRNNISSIPHTKVLGRLRFRKTLLVEFIDNGKV